MKRRENIPVWAYQLAIVVITVIWGGAFIVLKGALDSITPGWLLVMRFGFATLVLAALFWRRLARNLDASHLVAGLLIGVPEALGFLFQNVGLNGTTPGRNAFLSATYCVMVPFFNAALARRLPQGKSVAAALIALTGVGFLSLGTDLSLSLGQGDLLTLISAAFFALNIVAVASVGSAHDSVTMTVVMFAVATLITLAYSLAAEPIPDASTLSFDFVLQMSYVVLLSTVLALLVQNTAQKHVEPSRAGLLLSLESVFAVIFSVLFYHEALTVRLLVGFALIFVAVLVSELWPPRRDADGVRSLDL